MKLHLEKIEKVEQVSKRQIITTKKKYENIKCQSFVKTKVEDFWAYLEEELVPSIYQTKWYNEGTDPMVRISNKISKRKNH